MKNEIFSENDHNRLGVLSKIIKIVAKIMAIFSGIGIVVGCVSFVIVLIIMPNVNINTDNGTVKVFDTETTYKFDDGGIIVDGHEVGRYTNDNIGKIERVLSLNKTMLVIVPAYYLLTVTILCVVFNRLFNNLYVVFDRINKAKSPFIVENVQVMEIMAIELIVVIIIPNFIAGINEIMFKSGSYNVGVLQLLIIALVFYAMIYIYKYGCSLESKKGKKEVKE